MPSVQTTLVSHEQKSGQNAKGTWTLNLFKASNGDEFKTFEATIASQANVLLGKPAIVEYTESPAKDPKYAADKILQGVTAAAGVQTSAGPTVSDVVDITPPFPNAPQALETEAQKNTRIMRQAGLERALMAFGLAGIDPLTNGDELLELSDQYFEYFVNGRQAVGVVA